MGFFSNLAELSRLGQESSARLDVASRLSNAQAQLDALNASMAAGVGDAALVPATATVISAAPTGAIVGVDSIVAVELAAVIPGGATVPVRASIAVASLHLHRLVPGARLEVGILPGRPEVLRIRW